MKTKMSPIEERNLVKVEIEMAIIFVNKIAFQGPDRFNRDVQDSNGWMQVVYPVMGARAQAYLRSWFPHKKAEHTRAHWQELMEFQILG